MIVSIQNLVNNSFQPEDKKKKEKKKKIGMIWKRISELISQACRPLSLVVASHVCGHWREVALDFPVLWTKLNICGKL